MEAARSDTYIPALVLDAHLKSSLAAVRSLGRRGIRVIAGSHRASAMGLYSKHAHDRFQYPSPLDDHDGFVDCLRGKAAVFGRVVLFAFSDSTLLPLMGGCCNAQFSPVRGDGFQCAFDKGRTLGLAKSIGIEIPDTYCEASGGALSRFLKGRTFPLVVKPRRSVYWKRDAQGPRGVQVSARFASSEHECEALCDEFLQQTDEFPLVQEYVQGEEASVQFLCDRGLVLAACANRRLRSAHPTGGPGVLKETVPLSYHGMEDRARRLSDALRWSGPIMVEFKIDRITGTPKLMEVNGRFWGSLPLAVFAGVDFPYLYYRLALGMDIAPSEEFQQNATSRHFMGDLRHLYSALFKKDSMRIVAYPSRRKALRDFLSVPKDCKSDVLEMRDPMPAFAELLDLAKTMVARRQLNTT